MDFLDTLNDLAIATEAVDGELKGDYNAAAKAANKAIKEVKKLAKAGQFAEAVAKCDEAITNINNFKARLQDSMADPGDGEPTGSGAAKSIVKAVLAAIATIAAIFAYKYLGRKVTNKVTGSSHLAGAQSKVANSKAANAVRNHQTKSDMKDLAKTGKQRTKLEAKITDPNKKVSDRAYQKNRLKDEALADREEEIVKDVTTRTNRDRSAEAFKKHNTRAGNKFHNGSVKDTAKTAMKGGGAAIVAAAVVETLSSFVKGKSTPESMMSALDASIKALEALKSTCQEAMKSGASESAEIMMDFLEGALEALFNDDNSFILDDFRDLGFDEMDACEMFIDLAPLMNVGIESVLTNDDYEEVEDNEIVEDDVDEYEGYYE